jgi:hypothetical protein
MNVDILGKHGIHYLGHRSLKTAGVGKISSGNGYDIAVKLIEGGNSEVFDTVFSAIL